MKNLFGVILLVFFFSSVFGQEKTVTETFKTVKSIKATTGSGDIIFKKSSDANTKITVRYTYDEDTYKPVISNTEGMVSLEEQFYGKSSKGNSVWTIEMPDNIRLRLTSGSGNLRISELKTDVKFTCGSGDIQLDRVSGELDFTTGSGDIELENMEGEIRLNTGSGNITMSDSKGEFAFNAGSGDMRFDKVTGSIDANTGSGDIKAGGLAITGSSRFNTGSGNATVSLAAELKSNLSLNSGSGDSRLQFNGTPMVGTVIMTANKGGGDIVAPFKFDSEETVEEGGKNKRIKKTAKLGSQDITIRIGTGSGTAEISK